MKKNLKLLFLYAIAGPAFLFFVMLFLSKFSAIGKIFTFNRLFFAMTGIYLLLILIITKPLINLEKKRKSIAILVSIVIWILILISAFFTFAKYKEKIEDVVFTCSMYHQEKDFDIWWEKNKVKYKNISKEEFKKFPFPNGLITLGKEVKVRPNEINVGEVISYYSLVSDENISHRVIRKWIENDSYFFLTLGDNNDFPEIVNGSYVIGRVFEVKWLSFLQKDVCKDQGDYNFCKNKKTNLCNIAELKHCCLINDTIFRSHCFYSYAVKNNRSSMCCSVGEPFKNNCYKDFALKNMDVTFCDLIDRNKLKHRDCIFELGIKTANPNLCSRLKNLDFGCKGILKNITFCQSILSYTDYCYKSVAEAISNLKICNSILDETTKDACYREILA